MQPAVPPIARKIPKVDKIHGDVRTDNYYWLREKTNPEKNTGSPTISPAPRTFAGTGSPSRVE